MLMVLYSLNASAVDLSHNISSVVTTTGTLDIGNITSFYFKGDSGANRTYNVSEVGGVPGYDIRMNFTNVSERVEAYYFYLYLYYDGVTSHYIEIQLFNFSGDGWTKIGEIDDTTGFVWHNNSVVSQDFISGNVMSIRVYHYSSGNPNDNIYFDYFIMTESHLLPVEEVYKVLKCPIDDEQTTNLYIWIGVLLIIMFIIGEKSRIPIFNIVTGIAFIFYSFPMWGCHFAYGAAILVFGILMLFYSWKWKWQ